MSNITLSIDFSTFTDSQVETLLATIQQESLNRKLKRAKIIPLDECESTTLFFPNIPENCTAKDIFSISIDKKKLFVNSVCIETISGVHCCYVTLPPSEATQILEYLKSTPVSERPRLAKLQLSEQTLSNLSEDKKRDYIVTHMREEMV